MRKNWMFPLILIVGVSVAVLITVNYKESWTFNWKGFNKSIVDSVMALENKGYVKLKSHKTINTEQEIPGLADWIIDNSTTEELLKLTEYPNGTVKLTAYEGLMSRTSGPQRIQLIKKAIEDSSYVVHYLSGHVGDKSNVGFYLIRHVLNVDLPNHPPFPKENKRDYGLTQKELIQIVDLYENGMK